MPNDVYVLSNDPITADAQNVIAAVVAEFPPRAFNFIEVSDFTAAPRDATVISFGIKFGAVRVKNWNVYETYSLPQIVTRPDAATVLYSVLSRIYYGSKKHPTKITAIHNPSAFDVTKPIAVDIETGGNIKTDLKHTLPLLSVAFYQEGKWTYWVPSYGIAALRDFISKIERPIFHNGKFDIPVLEHATGYRMCNWFDTMLAHHALNIAAKQHGLKELAQRYLNAPDWEAGIKKHLGRSNDYSVIPEDVLVVYNMWDVYYTYELWRYLEPQILGDSNSMKAFMVEMEASEFFIDVEKHGFAVDVDYAEGLDLVMQADINILLSSMKWKYGQSFNPASPVQLKALFASFGDSLSSTDEENLQRIIDGAKTHQAQSVDLAKEVLEFRKVKKAHSTYVQGVLKRHHNGRIHSTFLIHGTSTGRLSSSGPNIQNIPRDKKYRSMFIG